MFGYYKVYVKREGVCVLFCGARVCVVVVGGCASLLINDWDPVL